LDKLKIETNFPAAGEKTEKTRQRKTQNMFTLLSVAVEKNSAISAVADNLLKYLLNDH
jgi:hypothetical protein